MNHLPVEVKAWAVTRMINEYVLKIDHLTKRKGGYLSDAYSNQKLHSRNHQRACLSIAASLEDDIARYRVKMDEMLRYESTLYSYMSTSDIEELNNRVLAYAFSRGFTQRFKKYELMLGWDAVNLENTCRNLDEILEVCEVIANGHKVKIIAALGLNAAQKRLFAVHGGMFFDFNYRSIVALITEGEVR